MKILVTGAAGFIATALANRLAEEGHTVHALVRNPANAGHLTHPNIRVIKGDISKADEVAIAMKDCSHVYHCAGYAKLYAKDRNEFYKVNLEGTHHVLEAALKAGIEKLVYTSSAAVMGSYRNHPVTERDPRLTAFTSDYELSKYLAEQELKNYAARGLNAVAVNPSRVYGPGPLSNSNATTRLLQQAVLGKRVVLPDFGETLGNYVFIDDVVEGHLKAMEHGVKGERYIIGGENISLNGIILLIREQLGDVKVLTIPLPVMKLMSWGELIRAKLTGSFPAFTPSIIERYLQHSAFSSQKAEAELGYRYTPFAEGIARTIAHIRKSL